MIMDKVEFLSNIEAPNMQIYGDDGIVLARDLGKFKAGTVISDAAGKNFIELCEMAFGVSEDGEPTITQPSINITSNVLNSTNTIEVGENFQMNLTLTFNPGSYSYGPATGVTRTSKYSVKKRGETEYTELDGDSLPYIQSIKLGNNIYSLDVKCDHGAGDPANTLRENSVDGIKEGTATGSFSKTITGVYPTFVGTISTNIDIDAADINNEEYKLVQGKQTFTHEITTANNYPFIAYPNSYGPVKITDANGFTQEWSTSTLTYNSQTYTVCIGALSTATMTYTFKF